MGYPMTHPVWGYSDTYPRMGVPGYLPTYNQINQVWYPSTSRVCALLANNAVEICFDDFVVVILAGEPSVLNARPSFLIKQS